METSTTPEDNQSTDAPVSTTATTDPQAGTDNETADTSNNPDTSTSDDTPVADGDTPTTTKTDDAPASTFDEDLDGWIEKKGYAKPENDEQRKAYQDTRNEQREFTRTRQAEKAAKEAKALGDEIHTAKPEATDDDGEDELDPIEKDVKELKADRDAERNTRLQSEYIMANKVTTEEVKAMGAVLKEMVDKEDTPEDKKAAYDYWTNPKRLEQWHRLAKAGMTDTAADTQVAADEAAQSEREKIAKESHANSPGRGAKNQPASGAKTPEAQRLERFSTWD